MPSNVSDQCCPLRVSEVSIDRVLARPLSRLANNSASPPPELHPWNCSQFPCEPLCPLWWIEKRLRTTGDTGERWIGGCVILERGTIYNSEMDVPAIPAHSRILALDVGSKRIGVAVTDPLGITAQGLDTIQRQNKRRDLEALGQVLAKYEVREIVVGLPLRLSGAEGIQSEKMRRFADDLHAHFGLTVHLWDERWTSTQANRLLRETDLSIKKRGQAVDRMAAVLILQSWLQARATR